MINRLIRWAVNNRLIVILLAAGLLGYGIHAFRNIDVEAYPDPAPAIVEVVARYPGASAEEVERQVTIPLEVALAGMPGLKITRTQSLFELCHISNQFEYGVDQQAARQEILNRLQLAQLPTGVTPDLSPRSPTGEIFRYTLVAPKDSAGNEIYDPNDLKSLQDTTLERLFRRLPRVVDVTSYGGTVKRYEIHPDPRGCSVTALLCSSLRMLSPRTIPMSGVTTSYTAAPLTWSARWACWEWARTRSKPRWA